MIYTKYVDIYFIIYYIYVSNVYVIKYSVAPFVFEATPLSFGVQSQWWVGLIGIVCCFP